MDAPAAEAVAGTKNETLELVHVGYGGGGLRVGGEEIGDRIIRLSRKRKDEKSKVNSNA